MSSTEYWNDEDWWYDRFSYHKNLYEDIKKEQSRRETFDEQLHNEEMYHYSQMLSCANELKEFGINVDLPE